jgi:hypothetical protein
MNSLSRQTNGYSTSRISTGISEQLPTTDRQYGRPSAVGVPPQLPNESCMFTNGCGAPVRASSPPQQMIPVEERFSANARSGTAAESAP